MPHEIDPSRLPAPSNYNYATYLDYPFFEPPFWVWADEGWRRRTPEDVTFYHSSNLPTRLYGGRPVRTLVYGVSPDRARHADGQWSRFYSWHYYAYMRRMAEERPGSD